MLLYQLGIIARIQHGLNNSFNFKCPKRNDDLVDNLFEYGLCQSCWSIYTDVKQFELEGEELMKFDLGTALIQLISLLVLGLIPYSVFLVVRYFRNVSNRLGNIERILSRIENQNKM
ncbi:hypothetical protein [Desulfuribacillus alkaliarsenatis]|uniref:Uncharacterized protein n=1 Tax=Desulfuribacillus alkaliarsenatis TaxID=766136 RepID=A0A1E5G007_9FIRM|nr:hypothetical protein [Desulfuribacillus alkaliarsenatis]OEF96175.1 hypothetical protein BHF68_08380 [Desulfuribacillus alkaliarsenatis]